MGGASGNIPHPDKTDEYVGDDCKVVYLVHVSLILSQSRQKVRVRESSRICSDSRARVGVIWNQA